jgi:hypothetical protein
MKCGFGRDVVIAAAAGKATFNIQKLESIEPN